MSENREKKGNFSAFVLFKEKNWDKEQFKKDFAADWSLEPIYEEGDDTQKKDGNTDAVIMELDGQRVVLGYMDVPVPDGEAEENAAFNYMWKDAVEVTKTHKSHMIVMILGDHEDVKEDGELFIKVVSTLCKQENVIGVYANGVVYQPSFYLAMKEALENDIYPLLGLVWFHMTRTEAGFSLYTMGMENFGLDEMEILDVTGNPIEIRGFLIDIALYCIEADVVLRDGETIGLTEEQVCKITRSEGVNVGDMTLKIDYHN